MNFEMNIVLFSKTKIIFTLNAFDFVSHNLKYSFCFSFCLPLNFVYFFSIYTSLRTIF